MLLSNIVKEIARRHNPNPWATIENFEIYEYMGKKYRGMTAREEEKLLGNFYLNETSRNS